MARYTKSIEKLIKAFSSLPGVGRKSAERMAFYIVSLPTDEVLSITEAISEAKGAVTFCKTCGNLSDNDICEVCADSKRAHNIICVVEEASDIASVESAKIYKGVYHVLGGCLSPLDGIGPDDLEIASLLDKTQKFGSKSEVIIATSFSTEGEATASYIAKVLKKKGIKTSRIAYGMPSGSSLKNIDSHTIARSLSGRTSI